MNALPTASITPAPADRQALARDAPVPSRVRQLANFVIFEAAWFACILGVAHGVPSWGTAAVVATIAWHVAISARPATELALVGLLCAIGLVAESLVVAQGHVAYPAGQPVAWLAPYWMVALWGEFAIALNVTLGALDVIGIVIAIVGFLFEAIGGAQMAAFKADPSHKGQVMDRGLWHYTRHPNYFGETCFWWGIWLIALAAGGAAAIWTVLSPLLMTVLLLKVSGVALLEKDIVERRPAYRDYIARTNAFIPGPSRRKERAT